MGLEDRRHLKNRYVSWIHRNLNSLNGVLLRPLPTGIQVSAMTISAHNHVLQPGTLTLYTSLDGPSVMPNDLKAPGFKVSRFAHKLNEPLERILLLGL